MSRAEIRERFLRDPLPKRLTDIAANLAQIASLSDNPANEIVIVGLLVDCKHFIEWSAHDVSLDLRIELAELQLQIVCWKRQLRDTLADLAQRAAMGEAANRWSERLLERSGQIG